jgi:hypothetical protein
MAAFTTLSRRILASAVVVLLTPACSTEFSGSSPGFSGGGSKKNTSSKPGTTEESRNQDPQSEKPHDSDATPDDITIEETEQCIDRSADFEKVLNFETAPKGFVGSTHANMILINEYRSLYGVTFSSSNGYQPILRRTTRRGEAQPPAGDEAWLCILCDGTPSRNRLVDQAAEDRVGRFVLSSTAAAKQAGGILRVDYSIAVASLSFDLIDVDGSESWVVEAFDGSGNMLPGLTQTVVQYGYNTDRTGNGAPSRIDIATADGVARIKAFTIRGEKPGSKFGFSFDNFDPGIPSCK